MQTCVPIYKRDYGFKRNCASDVDGTTAQPNAAARTTESVHQEEPLPQKAAHEGSVGQAIDVTLSEADALSFYTSFQAVVATQTLDAAVDRSVVDEEPSTECENDSLEQPLSDDAVHSEKASQLPEQQNQPSNQQTPISSKTRYQPAWVCIQ